MHCAPYFRCPSYTYFKAHPGFILTRFNPLTDSQYPQPNPLPAGCYLGNQEIIAVTATALTAVSAIAMLIAYTRSRHMREHPVSLIVSMALLDVVFATNNLGAYMANNYNNKDFTAQDICTGSSGKFLAFVNHVTVMGPYLFLGMISADLAISLANPFAMWRARYQYYEIYIIFIVAKYLH